MDWTGIVLIITFLYLLYKLGTRNTNHWKKKGIIQRVSWVPFVGENYPSAFGLMDPIQSSRRLFDLFKNERFGGIYFLQVPMLIVRDLNLLKQIMIKDAEYFLNRNDWGSDADPLMSKNLSALKGEQWRNLRVVMTTVFTAAKMKDMFTFMDECADQGAKHLTLQIEDKEKNNGEDSEVFEVEIKDYFSRYGTDVIASTAFGVEVNSFKDPQNEFYSAGTVFKYGFTGWNFFKMIFIMMFPSVAKMLKITFFGKKLNDYFSRVVRENIEYREKHNIVRKDLIHILMEARKGKILDENNSLIKGKLPDFTDNDIAAQAMLFYFGGFESMATLLGFICYELALHPDIQKTLVEEINSVVEAETGVTYEGVMHQMHYLDMVVNETLRKYPPATMTDRMVSKEYAIPDSNVSLDVGDTVLIPILALHYDPEYFPNPEKFDPERFRDEKKTILPMTFLPFGAGLRHCIGMRYALMEAKTGLVHLLKNFEIVPVKRTSIPLDLEKNNMFLMRPKNGFWIGLKPRK